MDEGGMFRFHEADITAGIIRFGNTSYQASNIASVSVFYKRTMNNFVQACLILALMAGVIAAFLYQQRPDLSMWLAGSAATFFVLGFGWQHFWPQYRYTLQIKMTNGDVQPFTSLDRKLIFDMKNAIESTFVKRT